MLIWLQAKCLQSTNLTTSSGAIPPKRYLSFGQYSVVAVDNPSEAGSE